ncbi:MAG TPA: 1-phosphofructokinase family hexose kinase [Pseudolabrys sp.]|nr:1-phosphofructokinase family hexose kinase [Pseudolabrys sp.]
MSDIVTITINPAVDIFVSTAKVEPTRKMRTSAPKRDPGGGGINVARAAFRLGAKVTAVYPASGAIGRLLTRLLEREGIDSIVTPSHAETRENFTAYEDDSGEQFRFVLPGSPLHRAEWEAVLYELENIKTKPKFVVASGSVPPGVPTDFFAKVAATAKKSGAKALVDTSGAALKAAIDEGVYLVKPNLNELSDLCGKTLDTEQAQIAACRTMIKSGEAEVVALTLGDQGALLVTRDGAWRANPIKIEAVSTVGAGDSFLGGMVAALAKGETLEGAFRVAVAAGFAAVMRPGTELCHQEDVDRLLPQITISEVTNAG